MQKCTVEDESTTAYSQISFKKTDGVDVILFINLKKKKTFNRSAKSSWLYTMRKQYLSCFKTHPEYHSLYYIRSCYLGEPGASKGSKANQQHRCETHILSVVRAATGT